MPKDANQKFTLPEKPYKKIALTFIILTLLLVAVIVYFSLSKATITLTPAEVSAPQEFSLRLPLNATSSPALLSGNYEKKELEFSKNFNVQTYETEPGKSSGLITIKNDGTSNQTLIATTRFLSPDELIFRLDKTVVAPAGDKITVQVTADEEGTKYDIAPTRFTIPGLSSSLQKIIYGISAEAMTGGVKKIGTLTAEDITVAQQEMLDDLDEMIKKELNIANDSENIVMIEKNILSNDVSNKQGDVVDKFTVTIKVEAEVVTVDKTKLLAWTKDEYKDGLTNQTEILNYDLESFDWNLEKINAGNNAVINTSISAYIMGTLDIDNFEKTKIYGLDKAGVKAYFSQYENIAEVGVDFWPFWVRSVPSLPDHIEIKID